MLFGKNKAGKESLGIKKEEAVENTKDNGNKKNLRLFDRVRRLFIEPHNKVVKGIDYYINKPSILDEIEDKSNRDYNDNIILDEKFKEIMNDNGFQEIL